MTEEKMGNLRWQLKMFSNISETSYISISKGKLYGY